MTFDDLNIKSYFKKHLAQMGLTEPTTIQERVFPVVMSGRDVMGIAQTGTGKTIGYLLPSLNMWRYSAKHEVQILILVPTRELVLQVLEVAQQLSGESGIMCVGVYGGVGMQPQIERVLNGADVVVGTPGRVLDIALTGNMRLGQVRRLILDEVDEMLECGFRTQIGRVLDLLPRKRQNLMFSATMTDEIESIANTYFNGPQRVEAAPVGTPLENINQCIYHVPNFNSKVNLLIGLLEADESMQRVMLFVSTIALADELYERVADAIGEGVDYLHSRRTQSQRFGALNSFRDGQTRILIATDLVARGIDIADVSHVVSFDLPNEPEQYIHRIGRTGRQDRKGTSIAMMTPAEEPYLVNIEGLMHKTIDVCDIPENIEMSDRIEEWEKPIVRMRNALTELDATPGRAFHEKSAKNSKTNHRVSHKALMRQKYGKPIKKRPKK